MKFRIGNFSNFLRDNIINPSVFPIKPVKRMNGGKIFKIKYPTLSKSIFFDYNNIMFFFSNLKSFFKLLL